MRFILGFDPGGKSNFGWCIAEGSGTPLKILRSGAVNNTHEAISAVSGFIKEKSACVLAAGIDSPLFWVVDGDRKVDKHVRKAIANKGGNPNTVMSVNSLQGACLIQGILTAIKLRSLFPELRITEAHPKAARILGDLKNKIEFMPGCNPCDHENDAAISALTAWAMISKNGCWENIYAKEIEPFSPIMAPLEYWIPKVA